MSVYHLIHVQVTMKYVTIRSVHTNAYALLDISAMERIVASVSVDHLIDFFSSLLSSDIDECSRSATVCDKNSRCEDRNGTFACCIANISDRCIGKKKFNELITVRSRRFV